MCTVTFAFWVPSTGKNTIPQKVRAVVTHAESKGTDVLCFFSQLIGHFFLAQAHLEVNKDKCSSLQQQDTNSCFFMWGSMLYMYVYSLGRCKYVCRGMFVQVYV